MTYDDNQMDTDLRACRHCGRVFYMRPWHRACAECLGYPHQAIYR